MIDDATHINIKQGLTRETATFFFLINPGDKGLFHDPAPGALKTHCYLIDFIGEWQWHVCGENLGRCLCHILLRKHSVNINHSD